MLRSAACCSVCVALFPFLTHMAAADAFLLELETPPAAAAHAQGMEAGGAFAKAASAVKARLAVIDVEQQRLLSALAAKSPGARVLYRVQRVYNGIAVSADPVSVEALRALPGVRAVHRLRRIQVQHTTSMPFLDVPAVWDGAGMALTGTGVRVGVIDTGIDYLHPDFGGSGAAQDHANNNTRVITDGFFPTAKVAGGFDFVGDDYDPDDPVLSVPRPDPDPMDQHGHGTHVSGTVAGFGVDTQGKTYVGGYGPDVPMATLQIGPGAAPNATLYALKVFGETGASQVLIPAIEWAVDPDGDGDFADHLDVINLSLGDDYAPHDAPEAAACDNAALAGVVVVASAGNDGDIYFATGAPGCAPRVISVAASEDDDPTETDLSPDRLASFSSRGPSQGAAGLIVKPDVAAPGKRIRSARLFNPSDPDSLTSVLSGTSMAAPHVAGVMALLRELHPDWTAAELKALIMNTAINNVYRYDADVNPTREAPAHAGAGRIDPVSAATNGVIAYDLEHPERVSLTFETREAASMVVERRHVRVENKGAIAVSYDVALDVLTYLPGLSIFVSPQETGPIAPGAYADIEVGFQADYTRMKHPRDPAARELLNEHTRHWISELSGYVTFTPDSPDLVPLRTPFYATMRRASDMRTAAGGLRFEETTDANIQLTGAGINTGEDYPVDVVSLVTPFELLTFDEDEADISGLDDAGDIKYAGVTSDYVAGKTVADTMLYFGIATWSPWYSLNWIRFEISIDVNQDNAADYLLYSSSNVFPANTPLDSDVFVSRLSNFAGQDEVEGYINGYSAQRYDSALFLSDVLCLPVSAGSLGLTDAHAAFGFRVRSVVRYDEEKVMDTCASASYDVTRPGLAFTVADDGQPTHFDLNGRSIGVIYDAEAFAARGALGALLLHHHNIAGKRAVWMPILTAGDSDGDQIPDLTEDGQDADGDGLPNAFDTDADGDGITDAIEGTNDPDEDTVPNFLDLDSDNDGLADAYEWEQPRTDPYSPDSDGDGIDDKTEGRTDWDGDGVINALDTDSDDDGIPDILEGAGDSDNDGDANYLDLDSDGDGIPDAEETVLDADGDGLPNYVDTDSDDDTLPDADELSLYLTDPYMRDSDEDGRTDDVEVGAGSDPNVPQPPPPAANLAASDGTSVQHVLVTWSDVPGRTEYRVYRGTDANLAGSAPVSGWITETQFEDTTAAAATMSGGGACSEATPQYTRYTYWVLTRNAGGEGGYSAPDEGYRGAAARFADALVFGVVGAAFLGLRRGKRQERRNG